MLSINSEYPPTATGTLNREFSFGVTLTEDVLVSSVAMPIGRNGAPVTVVVTLRQNLNDMPHYILRESFAVVSSFTWHTFQFEPVTLKKGQLIWIGFRGMDHTHSGGTTIMGPGAFYTPLTSDPGATSTKEYVFKKVWEGPFPAAPIFRLS